MNHALLRLAASLCCGLIFGFGLALSGMLDPTRVRGFLDLFGAWDPSLAFVLAGAVVTSFIGVQLARRRGAPVFGSRYELPMKSPVDMALLAGSTIFGVGGGLSGLCPGPAVASLSLGLWPTFVFTAAMLVGMALYRFVNVVSSGQYRAAEAAAPGSDLP